MNEKTAESAEWQDTTEKAAWRDLIPACADAISGFVTPGETVGELAELLAARVLNVAFQHRETLLSASSDKHAIHYPADSATVGCSCGWMTDVPLGHSLTDAYIDQHYSRLPESALRQPPGETP